MIVKGRARSGPAQLAAYLLREDGKEHPVLVQLFDGGEDLHKAFLLWHTIGEATRGEKTLYHAQIAPRATHDMSPDQWKRAAEILAEELGMKDHPRAIVVHEGGKNPHAHVVFQRTDADTMTLWDDGFNYLKHEKASKRMAEEFGHEIVPGKHEKRDRENQPEFPRADATQEDHQQAARTGMTVEQRKEQVTALRAQSDSAPAFKAALEEAGYILARGDKRGLVIVDGEGEVFSLSRQITDIKGKDFKAFMEGIDANTLPTVERAKDRQEARKAFQKPEAPAEAEKQGVEASKFVRPRTPEQAEQPTPAPQDPEITAIEKAVEERRQEDARKFAELHAHELRQKEHDLALTAAGSVEAFDRQQAAEMKALRARHAEKRTGIAGFIEAAKLRLNPTVAAEQAQARRQETRDLQRRQAQERKDYLALLKQTHELEIENMKEKHAQQLRDLDTRSAEERDRYIEEHRQAQRILADLQEQQRQEELRRGPEPPTRSK